MNIIKQVVEMLTDELNNRLRNVNTVIEVPQAFVKLKATISNAEVICIHCAKATLTTKRLAESYQKHYPDKATFCSTCNRLVMYRHGGYGSISGINDYYLLELTFLEENIDFLDAIYLFRLKMYMENIFDMVQSMYPFREIPTLWGIGEAGGTLLNFDEVLVRLGRLLAPDMPWDLLL